MLLATASHSGRYDYLLDGLNESHIYYRHKRDARALARQYIKAKTNVECVRFAKSSPWKVRDVELGDSKLGVEAEC